MQHNNKKKERKKKHASTCLRTRAAVSLQYLKKGSYSTTFNKEQ